MVNEFIKTVFCNLFKEVAINMKEHVLSKDHYINVQKTRENIYISGFLQNLY